MLVAACLYTTMQHFCSYVKFVEFTTLHLEYPNTIMQMFYKYDFYSESTDLLSVHLAEAVLIQGATYLRLDLCVCGLPS